MEIYLDNCATTRVCHEAAAACLRVMTEDYGNPSSLHKKGMEAENILTSARRTIGKMLGCDGDCVIFTGSATESNNLAILGAAAANPRGGKTIVTTTVEHPSVAKTVEYLEEQGYTVRRVAPKPDGNFDPQDFLDAVDADTLLLTFMMVNNEMGTVLPYQAVIPALKKKYPRLMIHMDVVQGFAKYPLSVKRLDVDLLTFSGHKLYAPKGIGALYVKKGVRLKPVIHGGGQEKGLRSGTHAVQLAAGLQEALPGPLRRFEPKAAGRGRETGECSGQFPGKRRAPSGKPFGHGGSLGNYAPLFGNQGDLCVQRLGLRQRCQKLGAGGLRPAGRAH